MFTTEAPVPPSIKRWIALTAIVGYAVLIIYLFFFIGFANIIGALQNVNLSVYLIAIGAVIASITFHALVWFKLLGYLKIKLGFRRTYVLYWLGLFVDNLVPGGWSGDLFKAYLLSRDPNIDSGRAVASVVAKNMYEAIFNLGNMVLGLVLLLMNYKLEGAIFIGIGGIMFLLTLPLFILIIISFRPAGAKRAVHLFIAAVARLSRNHLNLSKFQVEINKLLDDYHGGMKVLVANRRMLFSPMIYSFFAWGFEILTLYLVFVSLGVFVPADNVIIVRSIAGNIEAQGYAFAGYAQIVTTALYSALGVLPAVAASVGLLGGVVVFWLKTAIAYVAFHCVVFASCANYVCKAVRSPNTNNGEGKEQSDKD